MMSSINLINIDFSKYLFNFPAPIKDHMDEKKLIYHPFYRFRRYHQSDSFEGCIKWFEAIEKITPEICDLFKITIISRVTCSKCKRERNPNIVNENALSIPISDLSIRSVKDAIDLFQKKEALSINCGMNNCRSKDGVRTFEFMHSSDYLIINFKRFEQIGIEQFSKTKKIFL
jgi:uncharacterized UBP type Zn finger protein